jgi:phosphatidylethanolamine-binding protein (PEBP) family uncharacterized protein
MKGFFCAAIVVLLFTMAGGECAAAKVSPNEVELQVEYVWTPPSKCSTVSPEITVSGVPASTKQLNVTLTDLDVPTYNHGGGTLKYEGSNVIPSGALKNYRGPCPPSGQHRYTIHVDAIDASGVIVGSGKKTLSCCP